MIIPFLAACVLALIAWRLLIVYRSIFLPSCTVYDKSLDGKSYDFVIVGGGTAGCVLASRLSEHSDTTVLLLEAGKSDNGVFFRLNILGATFMGTPHHWNLYTQPEAELTQSDSKEGGRVLIQCRAKCLGGCSSLNLAIWNRGMPEDYNNWSKNLGCKGWGWKDLKPYFERCEGKTRDGENSSGFFSVRTQKYVSAAGGLFTKACSLALGLPVVRDFLVTPRSGVGLPYSMIFGDGTRCNAVRAYLTRKGSNGVRVCDRPNLTIATGVRVSKIVHAKGKVSGVRFSKGNNPGSIHVRREVILSAGTVHSPHILMHSGIGPKDIEAKYVKCKVELPGVGRNLKDFTSSGVIYKQSGLSIEKTVRSPASMAKFALNVTSPLHSNTLDGFAFTSLNGKEGKRPDLMMSLQSTRFPFACVGSYTQTIEDGQTGGLPNAFTVHTTLLRPKSCGSITIGGPNAFESPLIRQEYLSNPDDITAMVQAIKLARKVGNSKEFDGLRIQEVLPGPTVKTDKDIVDYLRRSSCHFFGTLVGTCKMGSKDDPMAVVDTSLCVHGVQGLRVVDASVFPTAITGFTHATVAAVAERAADIIKDTYSLRR